MLVNNAGLGELTTGRIHGYHKHPLNELCLMSNLNAVVPSIMFKMVLPRMESNKLGLCIVMGSAAGMAPIATLPAYGATKSFVMHLTKSLRVWKSLPWFKSTEHDYGSLVKWDSSCAWSKDRPISLLTVHYNSWSSTVKLIYFTTV